MQETMKRIDKRKVLKYSAAGIAIAAALAVLGLRLGRSAAADSQPAEEKRFCVKAVKVQPEGNDVFLEYTGLVQPAEIIQCTFGTVGMIEKIHVKEGDEVLQGQLLASLKAEEAARQQHNMQQLASQTQKAKEDAKKARDEAKQDYEAACIPPDADALAAAREERDEVRNERDSEKAHLEETKAQASLDKTAVENAQAEYDRIKGPLEEAQKKRDEAFEAAQKDAKELALASAELEKQKAGLTAAKAELETAQAEQAAAKEELEKLEAQPPETRDPAAVEAARIRLAQADAAVQDAQQKTSDLTAACDTAHAAADAAKSRADASDEALRLAQEQLTAVRTESGIEENEKKLADAKAKLVQSEAEAAASQTRLAALETELSAKQARVDALKNKGPGSMEAKLQKQRLDAAESALSAAESARLTAQNGYETAQNDVLERDLKAPKDGYVVKIVGNEGSMAAPIAPTVVLGSKKTSVQFGVSQDDVRKIKTGGSAQVTVGEKEYAGTISSIGTMPDTTTRTYMVSVEILADSGDFYLGEMAQVKLAAGEREGAWLPLSCVLNDGEDYVYIVENGRAVRRVVRILDVSDDKLLLSGLETGSSVIVEGMKTVRSGSAVTIQ